MNYTYVDNGDDCGNDAAAVSDNENGHDYYNDNDEVTHKHHQQWCFKCLASALPSVLFPEYNTAQIPLQLHNPSEHLHSRMLQFHRHFTYGGFEKSVCLLCVYLCDSLCAIQTACRQRRAFPVQTGSAATVPSVETKPQGNTMEPPAVTAVKASSDAPYARAMCTPAGTDNEKRARVCVCSWAPF